MRTARVIDIAWAGIAITWLALMLLPPRATGHTLGLRRSVTPEISERWPIAQQFRMNRNGLNSIEILPATVGDVSGAYRLSVRALTDPETERHADVQAAEIASRDSYVFRFDAIPFSADVPFQFVMAAVPGKPGRGIALRMTKGPPGPDGGLLVNGVPRWASLAFETSTSSSPVLQKLLGGGGAGRRAALVIAVGVWLVALRFGLQALAAECRSGIAPLSNDTRSGA